MSTEILIALSNPVEGKEREFEEWYWGQHIDEVLALPGFVSAKRYRLGGDTDPGAPFQYATIYEVEGSAQEARGRLFATEGLSSSPAMNYESVIMAPYVSAAG